MFKFVLTVLCAIALTGLGFTVAHALAADKPASCPTNAAATSSGGEEVSIGCPACGHRPDDDTPTVTLLDAATAPAATQKADKPIDVKNTKCIVTGEDVEDGTFVYQGKLYHVCCSDCEKTFKKDPDKYLKAIAADPAKYGIK